MSGEGDVTSGITVQRLGGRIGALIEGVRLGGDIGAEATGIIRSALLEHRVVFFRGQQHLDDAEHLAFANLLGPTTLSHPIVNDGSSKVLNVAAINGMAANSWHTDVTFVDRPPSISVLRGVTIPPYGGDTCFASTIAAYEALPAPLRALADEARAIHTNLYDYAAYGENGQFRDDDRMKKVASVRYEAEHPVVRIHPETGERSLLLGHFVKSLVGFNTLDSNALVGLLQSRITRLENTVRWKWTQGDVVIWDNRSTQHYAIADFGQHPREVRRITVAGEIPVGVDGQSSRMLIGSAPSYTEIDSLVS